MPTLNRYWLLRWRDQLGNNKYWPRRIWKLMLKDHLSNNEIFPLTLFLLANGTDPRIIAEYYKWKYKWNDGGWNNVKYIFKSYRNGNYDGKTYWDISAQKSLTI